MPKSTKKKPGRDNECDWVHTCFPQSDSSTFQAFSSGPLKL